MQLTHLSLENWKNFRQIDLPLGRRTFIVGPNAAGKSNFLDAIKFLREVADPEGGFQRAVRSRGGVSQIRCLHARKKNDVVIDVCARLDDITWRYRLEFKQDNRSRAFIGSEKVWRSGELIVDRPDIEDRRDDERLSQTYLEQVNANKDFRAIADFFAAIRYLHVVPQLIRDSERVSPRTRDPFGSDFLEQVAKTQQRVLSSRLKRINDALRVAVPQLRELQLVKDDRGVPHLQGRYEHWRPKAGWQREDQFSDGTLRLLGLLWALLDGTAPLLLEEPELSLHAGVVRFLPQLMMRATRKTHRQLFISTHSPELLSDQGIAPEEVVLLIPTDDGTEASIAADLADVRALLESGINLGNIAIPKTAPKSVDQLALFAEQ